MFLTTPLIWHLSRSPTTSVFLHSISPGFFFRSCGHSWPYLHSKLSPLHLEAPQWLCLPFRLTCCVTSFFLSVFPPAVFKYWNIFSEPSSFLCFSLYLHFVSIVVQYFSHVWLFVTPWTAAHQASLSFTVSRNVLKLMSAWVGDAIQPSHPLSPPSPPTLNLSQHQGLFQGVSSLHQMAQVLELQLWHQSF